MGRFILGHKMCIKNAKNKKKVKRNKIKVERFSFELISECNKTNTFKKLLKIVGFGGLLGQTIHMTYTWFFAQKSAAQILSERAIWALQRNFNITKLFSF
jgi:hypothetical protein